MKIPHILEPVKPDEPEEVLVFDKIVDDLTGALDIPHHQPCEWDNVRHIIGNLFYAWLTETPDNGCVYIGHYETKQP